MPSYLITGASRGIGLGYVRQLSVDQENVIFALVRDKKDSHELTALNTPNIHIVEADITDHQALKRVAEEVAQVTGGSLDVLINNAAYMRSPRGFMTLDEYTDPELLTADMNEMFNINVIGVVHTINAFLPLLKRGTTKKVVTLTSGLGVPAITLQSEMDIFGPYSASKAAINVIVAKYAVKFKPEGLLFVALSPGLVNTAPAGQQAPPEYMARWGKMLARFKELNPSFRGALSVENSVKRQIELINAATLEQAGTMLSVEF
ncbi:hypothetical protein JAAARDRAFT_42024 [Jaapia argillacea MUCL 33604]|uniref:NAD(P)-binding protein n=1 Tax=Jaapia argillacea MUCL 33604 TaxID=933084 RepID=A0A067PHB8_9AGAM|nr:hypothetical protein JAAARDRAFT_42024 [Jaapia argillacea MUCL 33604]